MSGRLSIIAATACLLVPPLAAQASPSRIIECGTDSRQRVLCAAGGRITTVKLVRDLSFNRCDARGSWGWIEKAVWADNRCRGRFEVSYRSLPGSGTTPGTTRRITCGTLTPRRVTCKTEGYATSVRMVREISFGDRCRQGSTWDNTDSFIWAGNGCRAEFEVTYRDATAPLPAQAPATRSITCGTYSGAQVTCKTDGYATSVRLIRELSNDRCRQGSNWGNSDSFIWANGGCRARFEVTYRVASHTRTITCGVRTGTQVQCPIGGSATQVRLIRELSSNRCRQGSNWGNSDSLIWANSGCRAEFEVTYQGAAAPSTPETRRITCGTISTTQVHCNIGDGVTGVRLVRDLSGNQCREGYNWGHTGTRIWANRLCRAEFEVTYRRGPAPSPTPQPAPATKVISCGNASGSAMSCNAFGTVATVRLRRDRSGGRCSQSSSWGLDDEAIWVARGCYGDFELTLASTMKPY